MTTTDTGPAYLRNIRTGLTAELHLIGNTEDGRRIIHNPGTDWELVLGNGTPVIYNDDGEAQGIECDHDGNWVL